MNYVQARLGVETAAQRAVGRLDLAFRRVGDATRIERFYQEGCLKARLPRPVQSGTCEAVLVNISGGIAGGDRLDLTIAAAAGAAVTVATQAAERIYRTLGPASRIATRLSVAAGGRLDYLPQETILFDRFGLERSLDIELATGAVYLGVESIVFGRTAMGESVNEGWLRDRISLRREGKWLYQDMTRLDGDIAAQLKGVAVAGGARAVASVLYAGSDAAAMLPRLRAALAGLNAKVAAGASMMDGVIMARLLGVDGAALRRGVAEALGVLRQGRPLPAVWQG